MRSMFTRTSNASVAAALVALSGCATTSSNGPAPSAVTLSDGMVVAGAPGWCVDRATTRAEAQAAVVIFGSCAALSRDAAQPRPAVSGIVTVSVETTPNGAPPPAAIEAFLRSDTGRAALSRSGRAESVEILETDIEGETLVLHAVDRSGLPGTTSEEYWRALFEIGGRVVTVSLVAADGAPGSDAERRAALDEQIARLKSANAT